MRIISGFLGGRRLDPPIKKWPTRPTTDRSREALFNILAHRLDFESVSMLELFGGTGAHSFEAISRGCDNVLLVEKHAPCIKFIQGQAVQFGIEGALNILKQDVRQFLKQPQVDSCFNYVFADPPYNISWLDRLPDLIFGSSLLKSDALVVIEHDAHTHFDEHPAYDFSRSYGDTIFSFFYF